jgi:tRNA/tmRNA/rRNA uracil-C5-methylase (TrmA/RlmC/RlmD family)
MILWVNLAIFNIYYLTRDRIQQKQGSRQQQRQSVLAYSNWTYIRIVCMIPFTQNAAHSAEYAVKRLVTLSNVSEKDTVLDVVCGSGLVSCELAKVTCHVTGIDITPAMIEQAN